MHGRLCRKNAAIKGSARGFGPNFGPQRKHSNFDLVKMQSPENTFECLRQTRLQFICLFKHLRAHVESATFTGVPGCVGSSRQVASTWTGQEYPCLMIGLITNCDSPSCMVLIAILLASRCRSQMTAHRLCGTAVTGQTNHLSGDMSDRCNPCRAPQQICSSRKQSDPDYLEAWYCTGSSLKSPH